MDDSAVSTSSRNSNVSGSVPGGLTRRTKVASGVSNLAFWSISPGSEWTVARMPKCSRATAARSRSITPARYQSAYLVPMPEMPNLVARLRSLYEEWFATLCAEGTGRLDQILAAEWVYTNYDGLVRSKSEYLDHVGSVAETVTFEGPYDLDVRSFGDVVLVLGGYRVTDLPGGGVLELRFTGLWIERNGRLQCLTHHNSEVVAAS